MNMRMRHRRQKRNALRDMPPEVQKRVLEAVWWSLGVAVAIVGALVVASFVRR